MAGATSLVQLILKKWGDDAAGAAKELEEKVGFPESVANRIATGELPMDEASRAARASEQGYGPVLYRGHSPNVVPESSDDMFLSDKYDVAETYARGGEEYDEVTDSYFETKGLVTPLRTNASNLHEVDAMGHDYTWPSTNVPGFGRAEGSDVISGAVKQSREMQGNGLQGTLFRNMRDDYEGEMPSDVYNILGSQPEVKIRHENAAFDPEYGGRSIMGNATVPMLGATAAATAGALAAPALMKDGVFQHGATSEPVVERKEPVRNQSSLLESVTDFGDEVFKSVRHAAGPLAEVLMPYEGVNNYLKTVNDYDKQPTWLDRLGLFDL